MSHLKGIKIKALHHPEYHQTERLRLFNQRDSFKPEQACLMKYFPKHYRKLKTQISMGIWPLVSKIRKIKTISHFTSPKVDHIPRAKATKGLSILEQRIFRNKRKSAKSVPLLTTSISFKPPQLSRFYPTITNLNLSEKQGEEIGFGDRNLGRKIFFRCYYYFWKGLRNVRHLELSNKTRYSWFLIKEMNSSSLFLSNLKTLKFSMILPTDEMNLGYPLDVLKELSKNEFFLRYLTHLDCGKFEGFQHYDELICKLLALCPNLVSLNFPIGREAQRYSSQDEIYKECQETRALEQIGKMENLRELSVSVYGIKTFLKHFSLPKSLQKIEINVFHSFYDPYLLDLFDSKFFENWKGLSDLQTLKIKMRRIAKSNDLLHKFVLPLLEMTPTLRKFKLMLGHSPAFNFPNCEALDISLFHETIAALKQLESFKISNCVIDRYFLSQSVSNLIVLDPRKCQFLLNLKKINIAGEFSEKFDFQHFLQFSSPGKRLKMSTFVFNSVEDLNECVQAANHAASSRNLKIELKMMLKTENLEDISSYRKLPIFLERNVTVDLNICWKPKGWGIDAAAVIEQNMEALGRIFTNFNMKVTRTY